jgi:hypothetical protein
MECSTVLTAEPVLWQVAKATATRIQLHRAVTVQQLRHPEQCAAFNSDR